MNSSTRNPWGSADAEGGKVQVEQILSEDDLKERELNGILPGTFRYSDYGDMLIIHDCPDRIIFGNAIDLFLDDLNINPEWVSKLSLIKFWY